MKYFLLTFLAISIFGCTHYYHVPNAANIPLIKGKNTFNAKVGFGGDNATTGDLQFAYSVSPHVALMLNSFFTGKTEQVSNFSNTSGYLTSGKGSYGRNWRRILLSFWKRKNLDL